MQAFRPFAVGCAVLVGAAGCGGRTGLLTYEGPGAGATLPGGSTAPVDGGPQEPNTLPPIKIPPPAPVTGCDGGATLIYVITQTFDLMSFDPSTFAFNTIGRIQCPAMPGMPPPGMPLSPPTPFSMAVDQTGIAYVVYDDGELFRVSTADASCRATGFARGQQGFRQFGMGYSRDSTGASETLYVASDEAADSGLPPRLGWVDTTNFHLNVIAPFAPPLGMAELTGTGNGSLYAFYSPSNSNIAAPTAIGQVDTNTADLIGQSDLSSLELGCGWAFAFWGGDFYVFTAPPQNNCQSIVSRFRPSDGSLNQVAMAPGEIVGAGVSTCAPVQ
jgi:hypothetical protein